ncbi:DUF2007 domain-containing protein [candidate division KSB1 bacterium]|nr:DUF2007 domain-containing protein [candidate division KSB1 bacterium]
MFCPECKSEYRQGFTRCTDCDMDLVHELPSEEAEFVEYVQVLATHNAADISFIKSILDGEEVDYFLKGELFNQLEPPVQPAILMVREDQVETANDLLKDLNLTFLSWNPNSAPDDESEQ